MVSHRELLHRLADVLIDKEIKLKTTRAAGESKAEKIRAYLAEDERNAEMVRACLAAKPIASASWRLVGVSP